MTSRPIPDAPAVNFTASYQRLDGTGWNHISITLRPGATPAEITEAIDTWRAIEGPALAALIEGTTSASAGASYTPPPQPAASEAQQRRIKREQADLLWTDDQIEAYARAHGAESLAKIGKFQASDMIDNLIKIRTKEGQPTIPPPLIEAPAAATPPAAAMPPAQEQPAPRPAAVDEDLPF